MPTIDREQVRVYLNCRLGTLSNRGLIRYAQERLAERNPPGWVVDLAVLDSANVLDAQSMLQDWLIQCGVLPDSEFLRSELRSAVSLWCKRTAETGVVELDEVTPSIVRLLRLCPDYNFNAVSIPIEEYPYPPSGVESPTSLARYVLTRLDELIPNVLA
ncbi:MAG: hypothetical protein JNK76_26845 [Planctomycetales bacterium]|nr:hypothetical protein [Planctomycetales bacterium]